MTKTLALKISSSILMAFLLLCVSVPAVFAQGGVGGGAGIGNPLGGVTTVRGLLENITTWLLGLVGALSLLALVFGGVKIVLGFADEGQVKEGKQIIKWAIIGLVITIGAYAILATVAGLLGIEN